MATHKGWPSSVRETSPVMESMKNIWLEGILGVCSMRLNRSSALTEPRSSRSSASTCMNGIPETRTVKRKTCHTVNLVFGIYTEENKTGLNQSGWTKPKDMRALITPVWFSSVYIVCGLGFGKQASSPVVSDLMFMSDGTTTNCTLFVQESAEGLALLTIIYSQLYS